jgi:hypothetical protein
MRILSQGELPRCTRAELSALLSTIAAELPSLRESSTALRNAHTKPQNIRRLLSLPQLRPSGFGSR